MQTRDFERLGYFYLGRPWDLERNAPREGLLLYESKDLVTHALCVGMTGSGKTGLCLALLEEAAIDGIPAIVIDPKGDLSNLLLSFPQLQESDFLPWINRDEARMQGLSPEAFAQAEAQRWKQGLADWGQDGNRIARLRTAAEFAVYTPGSNAGIPVSMLGSFASPPPAVREAPELLRERVAATVSGLLGLLGIEGDPLQSREHILLATLFERAWQSGADLDLAGLIALIQDPGLARIGVFELEAFYPAKERFALAMRVNNLLASPGFAAWMEGEPLDVGRALVGAQGRPRVAIFSIAHLSDAERMFFVTLLLTQTVSWMRTQSGTGSLRAILYMDEIFGYFPPVANPPSKQPLLTLLKQARAYGLGVVLATQNPVDLDYKGLANCGTWFLGRLQTARDKQRVLDGLEGAAAQAGAGFDRAGMEATLSSLGKRVFLMQNIHDSAPQIFQTRWTMSYLAGPLTRAQLQALKPAAAAPCAESPAPALRSQPFPSASAVARHIPAALAGAPVLPAGIEQHFLPADARVESYSPALYARASVLYEERKLGLTQHNRARVLLKLDAANPLIDWHAAEPTELDETRFLDRPAEGARFAELPKAALQARSYAAWQKQLALLLYTEARLKLFQHRELKLCSTPDEDQRAFAQRVQQAVRERRDEASEALRRKYAPKVAALDERVQRLSGKLARERAEAQESKLSGWATVGASILGAFTGRAASKLGRAATGARALSRMNKQGLDVEQAQDSLEALQTAKAELEQSFQADLAQLQAQIEALAGGIEPLEIAPRKTNIQIEALCLVWIPRTAPGA
jgi:hypothetical protein